MTSSSIDSRKRAGHCLSTTDSQKLEEMTLNNCFAPRFVCLLSIAICVVMVYTADGATCFLQLRLVFWANLTWDCICTTHAQVRQRQLSPTYNF